MLRALGTLRRRMVAKVFLGMAAVVGLSLVVLAWTQASAEVRALTEMTRGSAYQIAELVRGSIENSMLQGEGIAVKDLVNAFKQRVPEADIRVYDPFGTEAFGQKPPAPAASGLPGPLRAVLANHRRLEAPDGVVARPIPNEKRCHGCHEAAEPLRGVLAITRIPGALERDRERILAAIVHAAFVHVMTAKHANLLDRYFAEVVHRAPGLRAVGVYDSKGYLQFGARVPGLDGSVMARALAPDAAAQRVDGAAGPTLVIPLPREQRCSQCHHDNNPVRGVMGVAFRSPPAAGGAAEEEFETVVDTSLRTIMLSNLGRLITAFLREVAASGAVRTVDLYDGAGRTYFTSRPPRPAPEVAAVLDTREPAALTTQVGHDERILVALPLANRPACARCHGGELPLRGVVSVSLPTTYAASTRERAVRKTVILTAVALGLTLLVLAAVLHALVLRPVKEIGAVVEEVGGGNLDVTVAHSDESGDEVRRLGSSINRMIRGLRTKYVLERFVSKGTAAAAEDAVRSERSRPPRPAVGERRTMTVLFTDLRGFTAVAEEVAPETVVELLNRFLQVQTDVVDRYGGDIDKYVGDQVMALFGGSDGPARAVRCAVEMLRAVEGVRVGGIGGRAGASVVTGDVIYGPIGSRTRLDFTVIGDVVNQGAHVCATARGGEVLVSAATTEACGEIAGIRFVPVGPLRLKGRRRPCAVFRAEPI